MMINGIPRFRLPAEIVEQEIRLIVDTGIRVHTGVNVDADQIQALIDEYDAVCLAAGNTVRAPIRMWGTGVRAASPFSVCVIPRSTRVGRPWRT